MAGAGVEIRFDDKEFRSQFGRLVGKIEDPSPILDEIGGRLVLSVERRFELEHGPDGAPWPKSGRAQAENGQTLTGTGRLRASITHSLQADAVEVGTNVVYAAIHQFGGKTPPRTIRPKRRKALYWPGARHPVKKVEHPGSEIPARPFLGISRDDRAMIARVVSQHLGEGR